MARVRVLTAGEIGDADKELVRLRIAALNDCER